MYKNIFHFAMVICILLYACTGSREEPTPKNPVTDRLESKEKVKIADIKVDNNLRSFYAICADEHFGWCSPMYLTYEEAKKALEDHRKSTGHKDNTISNDCPFGKPVDENLLLTNILKETVSAESRQKLDKELELFLNPLLAKGIKFDSISAEEKKQLNLLGGGGQVNGVGHRVTLGSAIAGTNITVSVGGNAAVRIGMWFPLASVAAGQWVVAGPGSSTFQLNCNVLHPPPGCPQWFGQAVTITAEGVSGSFPVWVSYN